MRFAVLKKSQALFVSLFIAYPAFLCAQKPAVAPELYSSANIPDSLKKDANAVIRYDKVEIMVKSPAKAIVKCHTVETILNEKAEYDAAMILYYDKKFSSINSAEMLIYDADGKLIKRYKKSDMYDRSALADIYTIITDSRMLLVNHTIAKYPVTVEKIYEKELNGYLDLSDWAIQDKETSVQNSFVRIAVNPSVGFRYKTKNITLEPRKSSTDGMDVYEWDFKNLKAIKPEEDAEDWKVLPVISLATNNIEYNGLPGDMSSWKGFGNWIQNLNKNTAVLSSQREEEIRKMVSGLSSDKEKARFLYEYMQKNMRYVSIQLGIGGLKPFPASFVDEKKYGDCKALANYMYTLLKTAGIPSYYALVRAGENEEPADKDFVNSPFNHVILCVPFKGDTTWLECTSSTSPFGKLGTFTENRNALLITEEGGKLVNTPGSKMEDNVFDSDVTVAITPEGEARAKVTIKSTGEYRDMYNGLSAKKTDDQKRWLISYLNLRQPDILEISQGNDKDGVKDITLDLTYENLSDMHAGNKYFYRPRILDIWKTTFPTLEKRKTDLYFSHPMLKKNTTSIAIPQDFEVEALPENISLAFDYGSYEAKYSYDAEKHEIKSSSVFKLKNHVIPAAKYAEMQKFMEDISKSLGKKLVIRKKA